MKAFATKTGQELVAPDTVIDQMFGPSDAIRDFEKTLDGWQPPGLDANAESIPQKKIMDARSRDIVASDAYVQAGVTFRQDSIVGSQYVLNAKPYTKLLFGKDDEAWEKAFQEEVETKFNIWANSEHRWIDAARINDFTSLIRMFVCVHAVGGEVLATFEWMRDGLRELNTAVQMVECDRLATPPGMMESPTMRGGIERNRFGAPLAAWIRMAHPGDATAMLNAMDFRRVPKYKPWGRLQFLHIYDQERPDQVRGISDMVAALKEMKTTRRFRDITLQNAIVNATYAATIESEMPADIAYQQMGAGNVPSQALLQYATSYLGLANRFSRSSRNMNFDGAKIPHLLPGQKLQLRPAGTPGGVGTEFEASLLRYIAADLGVSYEELSRDYSMSNYASSRAAANNTHKFMVGSKKIVADRAANVIYRLWFEEMYNKGFLETAKRVNIYEGGGLFSAFDALTKCDWIGAGAGQIDELKETQAAILRIKNRLSTYEEEYARGGKDWRKMFAQTQREVEEMAERGIETVEDSAAINAASGEPSSTGDNPDGEGDKKPAKNSAGKTKTKAFNDAMEETEDENDRLTTALIEVATRTPVAPQITIVNQRGRETVKVKHDKAGRIVSAVREVEEE